jgi:hypothetical protein
MQNHYRISIHFNLSNIVQVVINKNIITIIIVVILIVILNKHSMKQKRLKHQLMMIKMRIFNNFHQHDNIHRNQVWVHLNEYYAIYHQIQMIMEHMNHRNIKCHQVFNVKRKTTSYLTLFSGNRSSEFGARSRSPSPSPPYDSSGYSTTKRTPLPGV